MEEELVRGFKSINFTLDDAKSIEQCISLCSSFMLQPSELVESWDVFSINTALNPQSVQESHIDGFRIFLQTQQRDAFRRQHGNIHFYTKDDLNMIVDEMDVDRAIILETPSKPQNSHDIFRNTPHSGSRRAPPPDERQVLSPTTPFSQRSTKCLIQYTFNEHLIEPPRSETAMEVDDPDGTFLRKLKDVRKCDMQVLGSGPAAGCRYMADQLECRFNEIERRMKNFGKAFTDSETLSVSQHVAYAVQDKVLVVGRICCDSEGHLNDKSVLLEGSVQYSGGQRVRLDLRDIPKFSIFPGEVLVVEGHNPSGHCLVASQIFYSIPLPPWSSIPRGHPSPKRQATELALVPMQQEKDTIHIILATGPFTTTDNLSFEPLVELFSYCRKKRPNLLLLMGPFIDTEHPQLKQGTIDKQYSHMFQEEIRSRIEDYCQEVGEGARVVLVPSTRDAFHDRIFPQPPFDVPFEDPSRQITLLSNPGVFCIDEISIGCSTVDIIKQLSSEESSRAPPGTPSDRMIRISSHIIGQRSFYPLFPPAVGTRLDLSLDPTALDLPCTPDILILPSDLVPFVKSYNYLPGLKQDDGLKQEESLEKCSSLIVNPGRLAKGTMGGTFVELSVLPQAPQSTTAVHGVPARTKASFVRI